MKSKRLGSSSRSNNITVSITTPSYDQNQLLSPHIAVSPGGASELSRN